ncbi:hypothetical protein CHN51_13200 [Sphingorhabdus sp. YGSMI21]|nr:hypothetical protein CHN51_13200 [Sphingorhabdus sp. YGSMI21]
MTGCAAEMDRHDADIEREALEAVEDALDQPSDQRDNYVRHLRTLSGPAKARAMELLDTESSHTGGLMTGGAAHCDEEDEDPDFIGGYRVLRLIARGGMGNVYLAERATDDFDLIVAIKLIKRRLITDEMLDRFRRERQILADLNHPNIARLFDGGETGDSVPYFVMEYVDGHPLDRWLKHAKPSLETRLAVFERICSAVEAAHQRLVIHRDLTPPNVLIADGETVKLIDFGIARPDDEDDGSSQHSAWTPGFAAPEQKAGEDVTTLSDVYGLGKLLDLLIGGDAPDELHAISNKAAAVDASARYSSVSALVEDVRNYRELRPVSAIDAGPLYVVRKFVLRQKLATAAVMIVSAAILTTLLLVMQAYRETELARAQAEASLTDTRELAGMMMFDVFDEVSNRPGNSQARLMLAQNAQSHLEALASDPDASYEARLAAGRGFYRLAAATGTIGTSNLGNMAEGLAFFERSEAILEELYRERPTDEIRLALARTHVSLLRDKNLRFLDFEESHEHGIRALQLLREIEIASAASLAEFGRAQRQLSDLLGCCLGRPEDGYKAVQIGMTEIEAAPERFREVPAVRRAYNDLVNISAGYRIVFDNDAASIEPFSQALEAQRALASETNLPVDLHLEATIASNLARTLLRMGRPIKAGQIIDPTYRQALSAFRIDPADNDLQRRMAVVSIAKAYAAAQLGQTDKAEQHVSEGLRLSRLSARSDGSPARPSLTFAHRLQEASEVYWASGQIQKSCNLMDQSMALYRRYADQSQLPMTSLRYRLIPMEKRREKCGAA